MAKEETKVVPLKLGTKTFRLRAGFGEFEAFERITGLNLMTQEGLTAAVSYQHLATLVACLAAGMGQAQPTPVEVRELLDMDTKDAAIQAAIQAIRKSRTQKAGDGEGPFEETASET